MNESPNMDMTVTDLAVLMMNGFRDVRIDMNKGFSDVGARFNTLEDRFDQLEHRHNARIEKLEDDSRIVRTVLKLA